MDQDTQPIQRTKRQSALLATIIISLSIGMLATIITLKLRLPWFVVLLADLPTIATGIIVFATAHGFYARGIRVFGILMCAAGSSFVGFAVAHSPYSILQTLSDYLEYGGATISVLCMFYMATLHPNLEDWRKAGERGILQLIKRLNDPDIERRLPAAKFLGQLADPRAVEPLIQALQDSSPEVRAAAAQALGALGDPRAMPALQHMQQHDTGLAPDKKPLQAIATEAIQRLHERE